MSKTNHNTHLTMEERRIIATGIENESSKSAIAETIGKEKSTVGKEIKLHRILVCKCPFPLECENYRKCVHERQCTVECPEYAPFKCSRRDRSPGACNGCSKWAYCRFNKYRYSPESAQHEYETSLVNSRQGVNLTTSEAKAMGETIGLLLRQGQSPYQIIHNHPELGICEKTLYNYLERGVFHHIEGLTVMDLRRQVSRRSFKKHTGLKKRQNYQYLRGRTYAEYLAFIEENPDTLVTQMDTVNNSEQGPFLQTFKFLSSGILFAVLQENKTALAMKQGVDLLESILGEEVFRKYASVLLTDRGPEFSAADAMETSENGLRRTRVYYCDPMQAAQKGSLENKHIELRYILPKQTDLRNLGLTDQNALNLVLSHVNSAPLEKLGGKSPLELAEFLYPDLFEALKSFGILKIEKDRVVLKPYLLK